MINLKKMNIIKFYKVVDVTNEYKNYSEENKRKYRSILSDDMIISEPLYKVVCKVEHSGKFEIVTRIWTKSEFELIKKNKYYLA